MVNYNEHDDSACGGAHDERHNVGHRYAQMNMDDGNGG